MAEPCFAWTSSRQRLVLGGRKVDDKSNEITAIPALLDLLTLKGSIPDRVRDDHRRDRLSERNRGQDHRKGR